MNWRRSHAFQKLMMRMLLTMCVGTTGSFGFLIYSKHIGDFEPITLERIGHTRRPAPSADQPGAARS